MKSSVAQLLDMQGVWLKDSRRLALSPWCLPHGTIDWAGLSPRDDVFTRSSEPESCAVLCQQPLVRACDGVVVVTLPQDACLLGVSSQEP